MAIPDDTKKALRTLGLLYLRFTHATDAGLSADEVNKICDLLSKWWPDATDEEIRGVLIESAQWHNKLPDNAAREAAISEATALMKQVMSEKQRNAVVIHLIQLAYADGRVTEKEEAFVNDIKAKLGIEDAG